MACVVYWLYDDQCICVWRHGYVGISKNFKARISGHLTNQQLPDFNWRILFTGSLAECRRLESTLRPRPFIGWNTAPGGGGGAGIGRYGRLLKAQAEAEEMAHPVARLSREEIAAKKQQHLSAKHKAAWSRRQAELATLDRWNAGLESHAFLAAEQLELDLP
jgi:hypothetical protein